jgi:hypothetical protein
MKMNPNNSPTIKMTTVQRRCNVALGGSIVAQAALITLVIDYASTPRF